MTHRRSPQTRRVSVPSQLEQVATPADLCASSQMLVEFNRLDSTHKRLALRLVGVLLKTQRRER